MADRRQIRGFLHLSAVLLAIGSAMPAFAMAEREPIDLVFVAGRVSGEIALIDSRDDRVVERITLDHVPDQFVLSETHRLLVATHVAAQRLSLFDLESMTPLAGLALGFPPDQIQLDDKTGMVALAGSAAGRLALVALTRAPLSAGSRGWLSPPTSSSIAPASGCSSPAAPMPGSTSSTWPAAASPAASTSMPTAGASPTWC
ncbi:MAG: hypothetical protein HC871_17290, partial [Rhizobiales bacterium]|nr:hypothetical protein [Hyphomicrobiales bacterium]